MTDLKIFGEHDERTVEQMWRCMGVGSVAGGVLCADGHLGYAQPVGGVIAYDIAKELSFGLGRTNPKPIDHAIFDSPCGRMPTRSTVDTAADAAELEDSDFDDGGDAGFDDTDYARNLFRLDAGILDDPGIAG